MSGIYLDYNASAPIDSRVLEVMINTYQTAYGNADSRTHDYGDAARRVVEEARQQVADLLAINKDELNERVLNKENIDDIKEIWINEDIILNDKELDKLRKYRFNYIPRRYFSNELREVGE